MAKRKSFKVYKNTIAIFIGGMRKRLPLDFYIPILFIQSFITILIILLKEALLIIALYYLSRVLFYVGYTG